MSAGEQVLLVDDESNIRRMLGALLRSEGFSVTEAANGNAALLLLDELDPDVVLLDLLMPPGPDGLETLSRMRDRGRVAPVIMMSGKAQLADAVRAVKLGAFQFLEKPLSPEGVLVTVRAALELNRTRAENRALHAELSRRAAPLIGDGPAMRQVKALISRVAPTEARVLITGESGTGKELVAAAIHGASRRRARAFVTVNCAAIPRDLVESEMFGHERGAFTGATERRLGRFELAHEGTLFLDEVGDLSQEAQAKLLRTLETGELQRIGAESALRIDARVVAATNRRLEDAVSGGFREDLFFRLNVFPIHLPPLRERLEDLPQLVAHLAERIRPRHAAIFTDDALDAMASYSWPGNVRELANLVERLSILSGPLVDAPAVRQVVRGAPQTAPTTAPLTLLATPSTPLSDALDEYERSLIVTALAQTQGNMAEAARVLQTDRANLYRRMRRLGLEKSADVEL